MSISKNQLPELHLVMTPEKLKVHVQHQFERLRDLGVFKVSKDLCEAVLSPEGYYHDIDSPMVQDILIDLQYEGLLNLAYYDTNYLRLKDKQEQAETTHHVEVGKISALKKKNQKKL